MRRCYQFIERLGGARSRGEVGRPQQGAEAALRSTRRNGASGVWTTRLDSAPLDDEPGKSPSWGETRN
jgi:hypothetical protein